LGSNRKKRAKEEHIRKQENRDMDETERLIASEKANKAA
jgi:hypothetical protein